jgi:hypothetical protein
MARCGRTLANDMGKCSRNAGHPGSHSNPELNASQKKKEYKRPDKYDLGTATHSKNKRGQSRQF